MPPAQIVTWLIPIVTPIIIAGVKKLIPKIPKWLVPALAPFLGAGVDVANYYATGGGVGAPWGAVLGAAGVMVREVVDQVKQATTSQGA